MSTIDEVKEYITEKFATEVTPGELPSDIDLLATGILTSVSTVQLLGWCGRNYRIPINSIPIDPDDLKTPEGIARFIESNRTDALA
jgi:acyl carrier protein